jgi:RNA polymerase-interacting CarD/CdnL/TRCF family regulator
MAEMRVYTKGDWVVHVYYGVGQVRGLEKKRIEGKDRLYYRVEGDNGTFWLPVSNTNTERVRPVVSKQKLQTAIQALKERPQKVDHDHKKRGIWLKEARLTGTLNSIACLVRDLSVFDSKKKLSPNEQDTLEELKARLVKEWSVVLNINPQEARMRLDDLIAGHLKS